MNTTKIVWVGILISILVIANLVNVDASQKITECTKTKNGWETSIYEAEGAHLSPFKIKQGGGLEEAEIIDGQHINIRGYLNGNPDADINYHVFRDADGKYIGGHKTVSYSSEVFSTLLLGLGGPSEFTDAIAEMLNDPNCKPKIDVQRKIIKNNPYSGKIVPEKVVHPKKPPKGSMGEKVYKHIDDALSKGKTIIKSGVNKIAQKTMWDIATNWFNKKIGGTIAGRGVGYLIPGVDIAMTVWTVGEFGGLLLEIGEEDVKRMTREKCGPKFDILISEMEKCIGVVCPEIYEECGSEENNEYCWNIYYDCMDECNDSEEICYENCTLVLSECVLNSSLCIEKASRCGRYCLIDKVLKYGENCKNSITECGIIENN